MQSPTITSGPRTTQALRALIAQKDWAAMIGQNNLLCAFSFFPLSGMETLQLFSNESTLTACMLQRDQWLFWPVTISIYIFVHLFGKNCRQEGF